MAPLRTAFVMEQALGHVTHYRNLREFTDQQTDVDPVWLPIPFDVRGAARMVPMLRSNWSVRASWRARRALDASRGHLDAVVFHTQVTSLFSVGVMRRIPTLISLDATPINYDSVGEYYGHRPAGDGLLDRQKYQLNRRAFHAAAGLVTWSDWARRSLIDDYGVDSERISVLAPGAGRAYFEVGRWRRTGAPEDEDRPVKALFVGADFRRKGGEVLLDCMDESLLRRCELHIVTQSDVRARPGVVVHRGLSANSPTLLTLFAEADLFVLPTHADCLGVALMEASAAALPVITTDVGALREAMVPDESGLLIKPGDRQALRAALEALVSDRERRQRMGTAAYALARQKFHAYANNRKLIDLVKELAEQIDASRNAA